MSAMGIFVDGRSAATTGRHRIGDNRLKAANLRATNGPWQLPLEG
jgi:hypothetical protein